MATFYKPKERSKWFIDRDGIPTVLQCKDDIVYHTVDFTDDIAADDTVTGVEITSSGAITVANSSRVDGIDGGTFKAVKFQVTGTNGVVKLYYATETDSGLTQYVKFVEPNNPVRLSDYR